MHRPDNEGKKGGGRRGKCLGRYSSASFRRLRTFCITHSASGLTWGITLTIPGLSIVRYEWVSVWIHHLTQFANYHAIPLVWRVELQRRGQAHLHVVLYGDVEQCLKLFLLWQKQVSSVGKCMSVERVSKDESDVVWINRAFVRGSCHMFDLQRLQGDFSSWRYLVAHESKSKQEQSGWLGRQWGVCYRSGFVEDTGTIIDLSDVSMYRVRRWIRRLTRRKRISGIGNHFMLVNPLTVKQLVAYALELEQASPF